MQYMDEIHAGRFIIPVLYEDNQVVVVVKPPNLPAQGDASGDDDLLSILKRYIGSRYKKPGNVYMGLVHRLDRPVGGVMVFARTSKAASRLSAAFAEHAQTRLYLAVLRGELLAMRTLEDYLVKGVDGMVRVCDRATDGAKFACLTTQPIACKNGLTLTNVRLFTGRSHQIRVQHAHMDYPLWGDARYGNGKPGEQIALFAYFLEFEHPTKHEIIRFCHMPPMTGIWREFSDEIGELTDNVEEI